MMGEGALVMMLIFEGSSLQTHNTIHTLVLGRYCLIQRTEKAALMVAEKVLSFSKKGSQEKALPNPAT